MIAIVRQHSKEKVFLVEEWFDLGAVGSSSGDRLEYHKYLGNSHSVSCVPPTAPRRAHEIAAFLVFAQHVQLEKTTGLAFTSDYQGANNILTDPQITSNL